MYQLHDFRRNVPISDDVCFHIECSMYSCTLEVLGLWTVVQHVQTVFLVQLKYHPSLTTLNHAAHILKYYQALPFLVIWDTERRFTVAGAHIARKFVSLSVLLRSCQCLTCCLVPVR